MYRAVGGTKVSGDVSGWKAMTKASYMCVHCSRYTAVHLHALVRALLVALRAHMAIHLFAQRHLGHQSEWRYLRLEGNDPS